MPTNPCFILTLNISTLIYISFVCWLLVRLFDSNIFLAYLSLQIFLEWDCFVSVFSRFVNNCSFVSSCYNFRGVLNNMFIPILDDSNFVWFCSWCVHYFSYFIRLGIVIEFIFLFKLSCNIINCIIFNQ